MWGVIVSTDQKLSLPQKDIKTLPKDSPLLLGMSTCHSLTMLDQQLCGNPLDIKMFQSTGSTLEEPNVADSTKYDLLIPTIVKTPETDLGIVKQHQFSSTLQRMSVVTKSLAEDNFKLFCKGSPEMVASLSRPETIPDDLFVVLKSYTQQGYRVIALGTRVIDMSYLKIMKAPREDLEAGLDFVGLIILVNQLKPRTTGVIEQLKEAEIKIVMITGDNIQTAVSVARECGIIEQRKSVMEVRVKDAENEARIEYIPTEMPTNVRKPGVI